MNNKIKPYFGNQKNIMASNLQQSQILADGSSFKTVIGTVTAISGSRITVKAGNAAVYAVDTGLAKLARKNGAPMQLGEILVLDKVEVAGRVWRDNSVNAETVRNLSLYAHTGTCKGKIASINPTDSSFTMESRQYGKQLIHTNSLTAFLKNSSAASFKDLQLGATAAVKGAWDRSRADVTAQAVAITVRAVAIDITGELMMRGDNAITVIGNGNVIYGADVSQAKFLSKNNKPMTLGQLNMGDVVRVRGKHVSESVQIFASSVKDLTISIK